MGLFKRVNDIISANINEMIDCFEDPEKMLRQAVREMEAAIHGAMDGAAKVIANEKRLSQQLADLGRQADRSKQLAEQAIQQDDDDAARRALMRKAEVEKLARALEDQRAAAEMVAVRLKRQIEAMRVRLAEARRKAVTLTARKRAVETRRRFVSDFGAVTLEQSAFSRFDRICDNIEQAEAEAEALFELTGGDSLDEPFDPEIEVALKKLKNACAKPPSY